MALSLDQLSEGLSSEDAGKKSYAQAIVNYGSACNDLKHLPKWKAREYYDWKPPPTGWLKLNVDGAIFSELHKAGVGVVLRDDAGKVILSASKVEFEVNNAEAFETLAIFHALQLCASMGIHRLIVESDSLMTTQVLNNELVPD
ncbi:hypothetical protein F2P56_023231, partial [Juglans regia]